MSIDLRSSIAMVMAAGSRLIRPDPSRRARVRNPTTSGSRSWTGMSCASIGRSAAVITAVTILLRGSAPVVGISGTSNPTTSLSWTLGATW